MLTDSVDWRADLGGGTRIALIQAGTFTTDAGAAFGPVPRTMWERLVEAELNPNSTLNQALNCLLIETPGGRVLVETGIGERMDEHHREQRGVTGLPILPALKAAGFDPDTVEAPLSGQVEFGDGQLVQVHQRSPGSMRRALPRRRRAGVCSETRDGG